ncbi:MAG: DUF4340 domain-containing protein [Clostridiales bacterium]|jgi:hypothetical protein|nr:DUF4340 domain-containing protein [Clostridiales bacterium]
MKRYRSALILLGVLAVMIGGYYYFAVLRPASGTEEGADGADGAAAASETEKLVDRTVDDISTLTIEYETEEFVILKETVKEKTEGSDTERDVVRYRLTNRDDIRADSSKLSSAVSNFCSLTSSKVVEEAAADLAQFGFDGPSAALLTGKFQDGAEISLEIGAKNPTGDGYYVRRAGENKVYLGSMYSAERILIQKAAIADLAVTALAEDGLARVSMKRAGEELFSAWRKAQYTWELDYPVTAPFNAQSASLIFESVKELAASSYIALGADEAEIAEYGLDKPKYELTFEPADGGAPTTLLFGREQNARTTIYAMLGGTTDIFTLALTGFGYLDKPMKEFVDSFAYIVNINQVNHITASFDGLTVNCDITTDPDDSDNDRFIVDGDDVSKLQNDKDKSYFRAFYQALIGIVIYDLEPAGAPAGQADITFVYEQKEEPYTMTVEFIPKDEWLYYVVRNGEYAGITVEKRLFDKPDEGLRPTYAALKAAAAAAATADAGAAVDTAADTDAENVSVP